MGLLAVVGPLGGLSVYLCHCTGELLASVEDCRCSCSALPAGPCSHHDDPCGHAAGGCDHDEAPCPNPKPWQEPTAPAAATGLTGCNELLFQSGEFGFVWERPSTPGAAVLVGLADEFAVPFVGQAAALPVIPREPFGVPRPPDSRRPSSRVPGPGLPVLHCVFLI